MKPLLLEIGVEELPARFVADGAAALVATLIAGLDDVGLAHRAARVFATPRRLAVQVEVEEATAEQRRTILGPPVGVAFGADGKPTKAASALAARAGCGVEQLTRVETEKGVYVAAEVALPSRPALEFLPAILRRAMALEFPKSMRWGDVAAAFARPVQWICCLFGDTPIDVVFADVRSGRRSYGHRFHHPGHFELATAADYEHELRIRDVIADVDERRRVLDARLTVCETEARGSLVPAPELREEVLFLVENPSPVSGAFPSEYLTLPEEVLMQEMQRHQRYFALKDADGKLLPRFVAVSNTAVRDPAVSVRGYERVLRARLADARFFFDEDRKRSLASRVPALRDVVFHHALGTVAEKAVRIEVLVAHLAEQTGRAALVPALVRAAALAKADLSTLMVGEFPDLQGVMGREYARHDGEPDVVAQAISDHYLPRGAEDRLPEHDSGALLGLADRLDSLCGLIAVGEGPTSTKDPFALRRACVGAIRLAVEKDLGFSLADAVGRADSLLDAKLRASNGALRGAELRDAVVAFFRARMKAAWAVRVPADIVEAVLQAGCDDIAQAHRRVAALADLSRRDGFDAVAALFKRVVNILRKEGATRGSSVDVALLVEPAELALHAATQAISREVDAAVAERSFGRAFAVLGELRDSVANLFDTVLVVAEDPAVRANRIALLGSIADLFMPLADFSVLTLVR